MFLFVATYNTACDNNQNKTPNNNSQNKTPAKFIEKFGKPSCAAYNSFGGFSLIFTDDCGCGINDGFFGAYWNISCESDEQKNNIKHANDIGDYKKWELVINFLKSRNEPEAIELLKMVNSILVSYKKDFDPFLYYDNIKIANEYLNNIESESFKEAFKIFYNDFF